MQRSGGPSGTGTNPPVEVFSEYLELEASVNKLEHREQVLDSELGGVRRNLLTGWRGSMLLEDDDDRSTLVSARTVSHFRKLAKLAAGLMRLLQLPSLRTRGDDVSTPGMNIRLS